MSVVFIPGITGILCVTSRNLETQRLQTMLAFLCQNTWESSMWSSSNRFSVFTGKTGRMVDTGGLIRTHDTCAMLLTNS